MTQLAPLIKSRLTLREAARLCSVDLPLRDGCKFRSPFRTDRNPSCSILRERLIDWTTGEHLDAIGLYANARGISNRDAIFQLAGYLGLVPPDPKAGPFPERPTRPGTAEEMARLAALRGFSVAGLTLASKCGVLTFGKHFGHHSWFVGDTHYGPMQARRLDGERWPWKGNPKAMTLKGRTIHHLIGLPLIGQYPHILICEGAPDLLSAFSLIHQLDLTDWCPLALLGTSANIPESEAQLIAERHVRIVAHPDEAGARAVEKWAKQLGGRVEAIFPPGADLNDLMITNPQLTYRLFQ